MMDNPYIIALYGWIFFNFITLGLAKDEQDDLKKRFNYKIWWKYHWDNVLITFLAIPLVVEFTDDLWLLVVNDWFEKSWQYNKLALMGAVPLVQGIYLVIRKLKK